MRGKVRIWCRVKLRVWVSDRVSTVKPQVRVRIKVRTRVGEVRVGFGVGIGVRVRAGSPVLLHLKTLDQPTNPPL